MPTTRTIQWLALPNGLRGEGVNQRALLSVFVAPRLRADTQHPTLAAFADFLNWAERTQPDQLHFSVEIDNGVQIAAETVSAPPDPTFWQALFAPETPVESFQFDDLADRPMITFPLKAVLDYLQQRYSQVAAQSLADLPAILPSGNDDGAIDLAATFTDLVNLHQAGFLEGIEDADDLSRRMTALLAATRDQAAARRADPNRGRADLT